MRDIYFDMYFLWNQFVQFDFHQFIHYLYKSDMSLLMMQLFEAAYLEGNLTRIYSCFQIDFTVALDTYWCLFLIIPKVAI